MLTLLSTLLSFLMGGLPKLLEFFQDRADKAHELALAQMQITRELEMRKAGFEAQERVEHIHTEQMQIQAEVSNQEFKLQERQHCTPTTSRSARVLPSGLPMPVQWFAQH